MVNWIYKPCYSLFLNNIQYLISFFIILSTENCKNTWVNILKNQQKNRKMYKFPTHKNNTQKYNKWCEKNMNISKIICHRKPERSFFIKGHQFPVCARCTGFYISLITYFTYTYYFFVNYNIQLITFAALLLLPAAIDGITQLQGYRESNNRLRFITGLLGGLGLGIIIKASKYFIYLKINGGL